MVKNKNDTIDLYVPHIVPAIACAILLSFWIGYKLQEGFLREKSVVPNRHHFAGDDIYSNHSIEDFHPQLSTCVSSYDSYGIEWRSLSKNESDCSSSGVDACRYDNGARDPRHLSLDLHSSIPLVVDLDHLSGVLRNISMLNSWKLLSSLCTNTSIIRCVGVFIHGHISIVLQNQYFILIDVFINEYFDPWTILTMIADTFELPIKNRGSWREHTSNEAWSYRIRGFGEISSNAIQFNDLRDILANSKIAKKHVTSIQTPLQRIDIYDVHNSQLGHKLSTSNEKKERVIFSNGFIVSKSKGQGDYYENLVHPAMITHPDPRTVAIIGGGDGGVIREVLKHRSVRKIVVLERDEVFMNLSSQYLPYWNDSNKIKLMDLDYDLNDARVEIQFVEAIDWVIEKYKDKVNNETSLIFDVIIMDFLLLHLGEDQYDDFSESVANALGDDGILVAGVGSIDNDELPSEFMRNSSLIFSESLIEADFKSIIQYEHTSTQRGSPLKFVVALKDKLLLATWMASEAEMNLLIHSRLVPLSSLQYFDAATMQTFQFPSRILEDQWCRENVEDCERQHGLDPDKFGYESSSFEVKGSNFALGGRGVFARKAIPNGSYIGVSECVNGMYIPPSTLSLIVLAEMSFPANEYLKCFSTGYVDGYGWYDSDRGETSAGVDPGIFTFVNHGCNGTRNMGTDEFIGTEMTIDINVKHPSVLEEVPMDPFTARHFPDWECHKHIARRDIQAGEELLDDYTNMGGSLYWVENIEELRWVCSGMAGRVTQYETENS